MASVERPWGDFVVLHTDTAADGVVLKRICVQPMQRLSLQSHAHRSEHWVVVSGIGCAVVGETTLHIGPNSHVFVPQGARHRLLCTHATEPLVLIEVQLGHGPLLREDDIVRYEDDYARASQ